MGRTKEFGDKQALEKAMYLFWRKGYENTSLKELLDEMNILNGSFYNTFGNKRNLFIKALENYEEDFSNKREMLFNSNGSFKKKIRSMFRHTFDRQKTECPKGCLLFNNVSNEVLEDREISDFIRKGIDNFEEFLQNQIKMAIDSGELEKTIDPQKTAAILVAYIQGMMNLCVLDYSDSKFRTQTEYFLSSLGI